MRKLSPVNQFKRILVPLNDKSWNSYYNSKNITCTFPETIHFEQSINPFEQHQQFYYDKILNKLKYKLFNTLNLKLYLLVKRSINNKQLIPFDKEKHTCNSYLQVGHLRIAGGMYLLMHEEPTMQCLSPYNLVRVWLQYGAFVDLKEMFLVEDKT